MKRKIIGEISAFFYSVSQFATETANLALSVFNRTKTVPASVGIGLLAGAVGFITSSGFNGPVIKKYAGGQQAIESDIEQGNDIVNSDDESDDSESTNNKPTDSRSRKISIVATSTYVFISLFMTFIKYYATYMGAKAWISAFDEDVDLDIRQEALQALEIFSLLLITMTINMPFELTNEIYEACELIAKKMGCQDTTPPYAPLLRPLAYIPKVVRYSGTIGHTIENILPMTILFFPPKEVRDLLRYSPLLFTGFVAISGVGILVLAGTNLTLTYLFEGNHTVKNLLKILRREAPSEYNKIIESAKEGYSKRYPFGSYTLAKNFEKLLYTQGPLHGFNDATPVVLALTPIIGKKAAYVVGCFVGLLSAQGTHFSEVAESQEGLRKIIEKIDAQNVDIEAGSRKHYILTEEELSGIDKRSSMRKIVDCMLCCGKFKKRHIRPNLNFQDEETSSYQMTERLIAPVQKK